jgi:predicted TIM-barrel fold metal-dependent hydrolase
VTQAGLEWIDAHHHLWDLQRLDYPWLLARGEERFFGQPDPIRKNYLAADYCTDTAGRISRSVHIQVGAKPGHELLETAFVQDCSRLTSGSIPAAAVVAVDLGRTGIEQQLEAQLGFAITRGVRHIIGKSAAENTSLPKFESAVWVGNWRKLAQLGLSFDLQCTEDQYADVLKALGSVPELRVAICHFASPWDQSPQGRKRWQNWMQRFAELPNAHLKISGLSMFTRTWDEASFLAWADAGLDVFGAHRCMLGSNFPVDRLYVNFDQLFQAWRKLVGRCSPAEGQRLAGQTAVEFYRI